MSMLGLPLTLLSPRQIRPRSHPLSTRRLFAVMRRFRGNHQVPFQMNPNLKGGMVLLKVRAVVENPSAICALHDLAHSCQCEMMTAAGRVGRSDKQWDLD
jgi:hypothetical protein